MTLLAMLDAGESGFAGFTMSAMSAGPGSVLAVRSPMISSGVAFSSSATLAHSTTRGGRARGCWKSIADAGPAEQLYSCQDMSKDKHNLQSIAACLALLLEPQIVHACMVCRPGTTCKIEHAVLLSEGIHV